MIRAIAESVKVLSRSKRSGKIEVAVTANGLTKTRHGVKCISPDGKPAVKLIEKLGEVYLVLK